MRTNLQTDENLQELCRYLHDVAACQKNRNGRSVGRYTRTSTSYSAHSLHYLRVRYMGITELRRVRRPGARSLAASPVEPSRVRPQAGAIGSPRGGVPPGAAALPRWPSAARAGRGGAVVCGVMQGGNVSQDVG